MKKVICLGAVAMSAASLLAAANYTWQNAAGGDLADQANFGAQTLPTDGDNCNFELDGSYSLWSSMDLIPYGKLIFKRGTAEIALGDKTLAGVGEYGGNLGLYVYNNYDTAVTMTSGTATNLNQCIVGYTPTLANHASLVVKNAGTKLGVGGGNMLIGGSGGHNSVVVSDGAEVDLRHGLVIGGEATAENYPYCVDNGLTVTGPGSCLRVQTVNNGETTEVGQTSPFNYLTLDNGAVLEQNRSFVIGRKGAASNNTVRVQNESRLHVNSDVNISQSAGLCNNALIVSNGSEVVSEMGNIYLGSIANCQSNRIEVLDGSALKTSNALYVGYQGSSNVFLADASVVSNLQYDVIIGGDGGADNTLELRNGSELFVNRTLYCGYNSGASGNRLIARGPGTLVQANGTCPALIVGETGSSNVVRVTDRAVLSAKGMALGDKYATSHGNRIEITDGATVKLQNQYFNVGKSGDSDQAVVAGGHVEDVGFAYLGYGGSNCSLSLTDGATFSCIGFDLGNSGVTNSTVLVSGANSKLTISDYDFTWKSGTSGGSLRIEDGAVVDVERCVTTCDGDGNVLTVDNATLNIKGTGASSPTLLLERGSTLELKGAASVTVSNKYLTPKAGSTVRFVADKNGIGTLSLPNVLESDDVKLEIDATKLRVSGTYDLVTTTGQIDPSFIKQVSVTPASAQLIVEKWTWGGIAKLKLKAHAQGGLCVIVR